MNARIIKETRSLLPVFCVTVLAATAPRLIWNRDAAAGVGLGIFTICCLILGASCFGNEYQWRTMPLLLAQPVPRRKIWHEKVLVLGTALGLGLVLFLLCIPLPETDSYPFLILLPFGVLCTAPYMALKIKNTVMAAVCTFALPFGLCGTLTLLVWAFVRLFPATGQLLEYALENHFYVLISPLAAIYCVVCYQLGYRNFIKLEAVDSQTKELALPPGMEAMLARPLARLLPRYGGPWASLIRKELLLQKPAFLMAGALIIAWPLAGLAWHLNHSDVFVGLASAAIAVLVFAVPFIASGMCVAEERNWGVSGWQLALPVSARKQWAAKMLTVVFVSVLLGVVAPVVMWISDGWVFHLPIGPGPLHFEAPFTPPSLEQIDWALLTIFNFALGYLFVLGLGVFASSACANSVKAILMNLGLMIVSGCVAVGEFAAIVAGFYADYMATHDTHNGLFSSDPPGIVLFVFFLRQFPGQLALGVLFILLIGWVLYLAYSNYRNGEPSSSRVWIQLAMVLGAIAVCVTVFAIFSERYAAAKIASFGELN